MSASVSLTVFNLQADSGDRERMYVHPFCFQGYWCTSVPVPCSCCHHKTCDSTEASDSHCSFLPVLMGHLLLIIKILKKKLHK